MNTRDLLLDIKNLSLDDIAQARIIVDRLSLTDEKMDAEMFIKKLPASVGSIIASIYELRKNILLILLAEDKGKQRVGIDEVHKKLMSVLPDDLSLLSYEVTAKVQFLLDLVSIKTRPCSSLEELFDSNVFTDRIRVSMEVFKECVLKKRDNVLGITFKIARVTHETDEMIKELHDRNGDSVVEAELLRNTRKQCEIHEKIDSLLQATNISHQQVSGEKDDAGGLIQTMLGIEEGIASIKRNKNPSDDEVIKLLEERLVDLDRQIKLKFKTIKQFTEEEKLIDGDVKELKLLLQSLSKDQKEWLGIRKKIHDSLKPRLNEIEQSRKERVDKIAGDELAAEEMTVKDLSDKLAKVMEKAMNVYKQTSLVVNSDLWSKKKLLETVQSDVQTVTPVMLSTKLG